MNTTTWIAALLAATGAASAQMKEDGTRYLLQPKRIETNPDGSVLASFDLSPIPLESPAYGALWFRVDVSGEGGNPAFAVWSTTADGQKIARLSEPTLKPDTAGPVPFPVTRHLQEQKRGGEATFLIEPRGAPGFSKKAVLGGDPFLAVAKAGQPAWEIPDLLRPIWKGNRIVNETVLPIARDGAAAEANLVFVPTKILSVKSYALDRTYAGGEDYTVEGRTLRLPEKSAIPFLRHDELYHNVPGREPGAMKAADGGFLAFSETAFFNDRQLAVTYEHAGTWDGPVPQPARNRLPRTFAKLEKSEPLKIAVFGDSISFGASASGAAARPPWMPRWSDLLADTLTRATGSRIDCINASLGGTRSDWGKRTAAGLVAHESPDLTILGFGMNDGSAKVPPEAFAGNLRAIMDTVRERNPNAEFLLLMSFQPNPKWRPLEPMPAYLETMKGMEGPGVALADLWTMHGHLLRHKDYADMTGNHVNHPNDFLARVYAQVTLATLGVEEPFR